MMAHQGPWLVSEAARRGLAKVWDILSLVAAKLGQVHFQNGDKDQSLMRREMAGRGILGWLRVTMWGHDGDLRRCWQMEGQ